MPCVSRLKSSCHPVPLKNGGRNIVAKFGETPLTSGAPVVKTGFWLQAHM
jgi:hypothetical protein